MTEPLSGDREADPLTETIRAVGVMIALDFQHTLSDVSDGGERKMQPGPQTRDLAERYVTAAQRPLLATIDSLTEQVRRLQLHVEMHEERTDAAEADRDEWKSACEYWRASAEERLERAVEAESERDRLVKKLVESEQESNRRRAGWHRTEAERDKALGVVEQWEAATDGCAVCHARFDRLSASKSGGRSPGAPIPSAEPTIKRCDLCHSREPHHGHTVLPDRRILPNFATPAAEPTQGEQ